ncbi:MAG: hypothetical protein AB7U41_07345 [Dongiaceae bacterium]
MAKSSTAERLESTRPYIPAFKQKTKAMPSFKAPQAPKAAPVEPTDIETVAIIGGERD